jgi:hypothetical membrane protein
MKDFKNSKIKNDTIPADSAFIKVLKIKQYILSTVTISLILIVIGVFSSQSTMNGFISLIVFIAGRFMIKIILNTIFDPILQRILDKQKQNEN